MRSLPRLLIEPTVRAALAEDLGRTGDVTTDSIIGPDDVAMIEQDVGLLNRGYLLDQKQAIGKKLTRPAQADQILTPSQLQRAESVRRGDQVVILASSSGISVRMQGEALSDGAMGQQISVRNLSSQRVVRARVIGPGQVEVRM